MRIVVTGSREWKDCEFIHDVLNALHQEHGVTALAEGGCRGADACAFSWVASVEIEDLDWHEFRADWERSGPAAGPIRNARMLDDFKPDLVVAFKVKAKSRGTNDCIQKAKDRGIPVIVYIGPEKVEDTRATQARK